MLNPHRISFAATEITRNDSVVVLTHYKMTDQKGIGSKLDIVGTATLEIPDAGTYMIRPVYRFFTASRYEIFNEEDTRIGEILWPSATWKRPRIILQKDRDREVWTFYLTTPRSRSHPDSYTTKLKHNDREIQYEITLHASWLSRIHNGLVAKLEGHASFSDPQLTLVAMFGIYVNELFVEED